MTTPFVRPYNPDTDFAAGLNVFKTTADPSVSHAPALTIGSNLWYTPYVTLTPSTCFVLDSGTGTAVGYIIGTPDTTTFSQSWLTSFVPSIDRGIVPHPDTVSPDPAMETDLVRGLRREVYAGTCTMLQSHASLLETYPAHLHINLLPEYTGKGWGKVLMGAFLEKMRGMGVRGVHLGMVATNDGAGRFYMREGFERCGEVLDGGVSGEKGRDGGAVCMVRRLD